MEGIDDMQYKNLRLIQDPEKFCFTTDSVLLSAFASAKRTDRVVDIGSGTGVLSFLLNARTSASVTGIELRQDVLDMANRSKELNNSVGISFYNMDLRDAPAAFGDGAFDVAICNPPYFDGSIRPKEENKVVSRHMTECSIEDVCVCAKRLLHEGGKLYMVFPTSRLFELAKSMTDNRLNIKRIRTVQHSEAQSPHIALIEAKRGAAFSCIWEKPLILCNEHGEYTEETARIYHII